MALTLGILALVEAKPGKEAEVEAFVKSGQAIVEREPGTRVWYGFRVNESTFGIFDAFEDEAARQAHLDGEIPAGLATAGPELLAKDPDLRPVDVLAVKGGTTARFERLIGRGRQPPSPDDLTAATSPPPIYYPLRGLTLPPRPS